MKTKDSIIINSSASDVWEILKDPGNMPAWNHKCCSCNGTSEIAVGSTFDATFKLNSNPPKVTSCEILELKPSEKITTRYSDETFGSKEEYVDETFNLISRGPKETKLEHEVDLSHSKIPFIVKFIMWFLNKFGYSVGRSSLDEIKDLVENKAN